MDSNNVWKLFPFDFLLLQDLNFRFSKNFFNDLFFQQDWQDNRLPCYSFSINNSSQKCFQIHIKQLALGFLAKYLTEFSR